MVEDIEPEAFKQMLRFIYTDSCEAGAVEAMADHLLVAATRYQLGRLQVMCELQLSKTLTIENAVDRLLLADLHSADQLKEEAVRFITLHMTDVLRHSVTVKTSEPSAMRMVEPGFTDVGRLSYVHANLVLSPLNE